MSSNRLLHLKKKKGIQEFDKIIEKECVLIPSDISTHLVGEQLKKKFGESYITIAKSSSNPARAIRNFEKHHLLVRSDKALEDLKKSFPDISAKMLEDEPLFYKDQDYRSFKGRAKPHKLLDFESFFIDKPFMVSFNTGLEIKEQDSFDLEIVSIKKEGINWELHLSDESKVLAKNLYWGRSRKEYYDLLDVPSRENINKQELEFLLSVQENSLLSVYFEFNKCLHETSRTLFIPQSQTYDRGHYILDFNRPDKDSGKQEMTASIVIHNRDADEHELGEKIKKMKRKLNKLFPGFVQSIKMEEINYFPNLLSRVENVESREKFENLPEFIGTQSLNLVERSSIISNAFKSYEYSKNI